MNDTINFDEILADLEKQPHVRVKRDPAHTLDVTSTKNSGASHKYRVIVPIGYEETIDEDEMVTRCDNRGDALDLRNGPGKRCHFGGHVEWVNETTCDVTVWVD